MKKFFIVLSIFFSLNSVFGQKLALVKTDGKFGFLNESGQFTIEPQYKEAKEFSEGYAAVKQGNLWGFIDKKNN